MFIVNPNPVTSGINYSVEECGSCISAAFKVIGSYSDTTKLYFKDTNSATFGLKVNSTSLTVFTDDSRESSKLATLSSGVHYVGICMNLGNPGSIRVVVDSEEVWNWTGKTGEGNAVVSWNIPYNGTRFEVQNFMIANFDIAGYMLAIPAADLLTEEQIVFTEVGKSQVQMVDVNNLKEIVSVPGFNIKAVGFTGTGINNDSNKVDQLETAINDIAVETVTIKNKAITGSPILRNPSTQKEWTLGSLKSAKFKITTMKG